MCRGRDMRTRAGLPVTLLALAALAVAGCGSEEGSGDIPAGEGEELLALLDQVRTADEQGNCDAADSAAGQFSERVSSLQGRVEDSTLASLQEGAGQLDQLVEEDCTEEGTTDTETTATTTDTVEPVPEETTTETAEETTTEEEPEEEPEVPEQPSGEGGSGPPGPVGNPSEPPAGAGPPGGTPSDTGTGGIEGEE